MFVQGLLLESCPDINVSNADGLTPLHAACQADSEFCAAVLVWNLADVNASDNDGKLPIHFAAASNSIGCVKLLMEKGLNADTGDCRSKKTPLHYAAENDAYDCAKFLIENGAGVNVTDLSGQVNNFSIQTINEKNKDSIQF